MDAQTTAMMKQHESLITASLAAAEQMVFKARMERSAIEFDLRATYSRIGNLQARVAGMKDQHAKAIDAVNVALERQEALRTVLHPIAPWMFAVPAGDGPRPVEKLTAAQFDQYAELGDIEPRYRAIGLLDIEAGSPASNLVTLERFEPVVGMDPAPALGSKIGVGQFLRAKA